MGTKVDLFHVKIKNYQFKIKTNTFGNRGTEANLKNDFFLKIPFFR